MPVIIVATDYSAVGGNAVNYACQLAASQNARIVILHSFMIPVMFSDVPIPGTLITDAEKDAEDRMEQLITQSKSAYPGLCIDGKVIYGTTIDALDEYAEENAKPWLIVVGNAGSDTSSWPSSVLMDAFKKLAYPILAIPGNATYKPTRSICFAFDNKHTGNTIAIEQINQFTKQMNAALHVLNIQPSNDTQEIDPTAKKLLSVSNPQYHFVRGTDNVDNSIHDFTVTNNTDWLIMIPREHSFFEGLFHKSHTKAVTHHSHIPILAIHETSA